MNDYEWWKDEHLYSIFDRQANPNMIQKAKAYNDDTQYLIKLIMNADAPTQKPFSQNERQEYEELKQQIVNIRRIVGVCGTPVLVDLQNFGNKFGPTGEPRCPKCNNSFQNDIPAGNTNKRCCANCKYIFNVY